MVGSNGFVCVTGAAAAPIVRRPLCAWQRGTTAAVCLAARMPRGAAPGLSPLALSVARALHAARSTPSQPGGATRDPLRTQAPAALAMRRRRPRQSGRARASAMRTAPARPARRRLCVSSGTARHARARAVPCCRAVLLARHRTNAEVVHERCSVWLCARARGWAGGGERRVVTEDAKRQVTAPARGARGARRLCRLRGLGTPRGAWDTSWPRVGGDAEPRGRGRGVVRAARARPVYPRPGSLRGVQVRLAGPAARGSGRRAVVLPAHPGRCCLEGM